jgi:hypothetical protein
MIQGVSDSSPEEEFHKIRHLFALYTISRLHSRQTSSNQYDWNHHGTSTTIATMQEPKSTKKKVTKGGKGELATVTFVFLRGKSIVCFSTARLCTGFYVKAARDPGQ